MSSYRGRAWCDECDMESVVVHVTVGGGEAVVEWRCSCGWKDCWVTKKCEPISRSGRIRKVRVAEGV